MSEYDLSSVPDFVDERYVARRAEYLESEYGIRANIAEGVAWRELGYSHSGIATKVDMTENTVSNWMEEIADEFGLPATETRPQSDPRLE